jgi:O-methyltransferase
MRAILKAHGVTDRTVFAADSFEGLPKPDAGSYPADTGDRHWTFTELAVSLKQVRANLDRYGLLDDQVQFSRGGSRTHCRRRRSSDSRWRAWMGTCMKAR